MYIHEKLCQYVFNKLLVYHTQFINKQNINFSFVQIQNPVVMKCTASYFHQL